MNLIERMMSFLTGIIRQLLERAQNQPNTALSQYVLDCFAMFAYFTGEPGGMKVKALLDEARDNKSLLYFSIINFGELYYMAHKKLGIAKAQEMVADTKRLPIQFVSVQDSHVWGAAELKARFALSYADAFAAHLAQSLGIPVVTGDPEFKNIGTGLKILWILP